MEIKEAQLQFQFKRIKQQRVTNEIHLVKMNLELIKNHGLVRV